MPTAHHRKDCPGRCGVRIIHAMVACGPCGQRLPVDLREALDAAFLNPKDPASATARLLAVRAALAWYRQRNAEAATCGSRGETL